MPRILSVLLLLNLLLFAGCGGGGSSDSSDAQPGPADRELNNRDTNLILADEWSEIKMDANMAKTSVDFTGHFITSRNACGRDASGAMELKAWNNLARAVNEAVHANLVTTDKKTCIPFPDNSKMDGTVEITLGDGTKKAFFENVNQEACTPIADRETARKLFDALNSVVLLADKTDCANGWGG